MHALVSKQWIRLLDARYRDYISSRNLQLRANFGDQLERSQPCEMIVDVPGGDEFVRLSLIEKRLQPTQHRLWRAHKRARQRLIQHCAFGGRGKICFDVVYWRRQLAR
jgi:hypothetical protein